MVSARETTRREKDGLTGKITMSHKAKTYPYTENSHRRTLQKQGRKLPMNEAKTQQTDKTDTERTLW